MITSSNASGLEQSLSKWWDNVPAVFAHRAYTNHLRSAHNMYTAWNETWLREFSSRHPLQSLRVVDYGIGAGLLGELLLNRYDIMQYVGVDVSDASIKSADHLLSHKVRPRREWQTPLWRLMRTPVEFASVGADVFISQAVVQHFPTRAYTDAFLANLERSRIPTLLIQIKASHGHEPTFLGDTEAASSGASEKAQVLNETVYGKVVVEATRLTPRYMLAALPSYRLTWQCLMLGRYNCWEAPRAKRPGSKHEAIDTLPNAWLQLMRSKRMHGEAILEFVRAPGAS